jgi:thiosulfate/3-mercaptopyruvate sulfurtransferase
MLRPELLATYDYVRNGQAQIIDARTVEEFEAGPIPGAVNIPYESVLDEKRIKDEASLKDLFAGLTQDRPVIAYTSTGVKATMVWFALSLLGYDSRVYSWQDWLDHQPKINISLKEATADPNPAKTGDVVKITAIFEEETAAAQTAPVAPAPTTSPAAEVAAEPAEPMQENASNETVLTIKGCATCGFGSPQGFADISIDTGVVQIGSKGKPSASDNGFRCTAIVNSPSGTEVGKVIMKRIAGDEFAGIWNANVASGKYSVDIVASAGEASKTFSDALEIEVAGSSKYKNLG